MSEQRLHIHLEAQTSEVIHYCYQRQCDDLFLGLERDNGSAYRVVYEREVVYLIVVGSALQYPIA